MDKAVLLAVAASLCTATASVCQRAGARNTGPAPGGFDARLIVRLARQPTWLLGIAAGIGVFLRLAAPSGGRLHAPGSSWLLAGLVTGGVVLAALAVAYGLCGRRGASPVTPGRGARIGYRDL